VFIWSEDPRTTQTVQWRTSTAVPGGMVRYRNTENEDWQSVKADCEVIEDRLLMNDRYMHHFTAVLRGLRPDTEYIYQAGSKYADTWSEEARFRTAPEENQPFSFLYFGDTHCSEAWGDIATAAAAQQPDARFVLIGGDLVSTGLYRDEWDRFLAYSNGLFEEKPLAFSLGNHDDQDGLGAWLPLALFALPQNGPEDITPERTYSFPFSNSLFLLLDVGSPFMKQGRWMKEQLAGTDAAWRFGVYHFPLYSFPEDAEYGMIKGIWEKVFAEEHLDIMLHGHVHHYLRTKPMRLGEAVSNPAGGTIYMISLGTAGKKQDRETPAFAEKYHSGGPWYVKFEIDGNRLRCTAHEKDGTVFDMFRITK
jgi:acid phosphatase type 7